MLLELSTYLVVYPATHSVLSATVYVFLSAFFIFPFHLNQSKQIQSVHSGPQICSTGAFPGLCCTLLDLGSSVGFLPNKVLLHTFRCYFLCTNNDFLE